MTYSVLNLRADLAATIAALRDDQNPMPVERAKAISDVAQTIINSAKVEVDLINAIGRGRVAPTGFLPTDDKDTLDRQAALEHAPQAKPGNGLPPQAPTARP